MTDIKKKQTLTKAQREKLNKPFVSPSQISALSPILTTTSGQLSVLPHQQEPPSTSPTTLPPAPPLKTGRINQHYDMTPEDQKIFDAIADAVENIDKSIKDPTNSWMPDSTISFDRFKTMVFKQLEERSSSDGNQRFPIPPDTLTRSQLNAFFTAYNDCIKAVIDQNMSVDTGFAEIGGKTQLPRLITGELAVKRKALGESIFSSAVTGKPYCVFTRKLQDGSSYMPATDYYNQPELIYTTEAYLYRQLSNSPEIPEFVGLSKENIMAITRKADVQYFATLSPKEVASRRKRLKDMAQNLARSHALPKPLPGFESWDMSNKLSVALMKETSVHNSYHQLRTHQEQIYAIRLLISKSVYTKSISPLLPEHAKYYYEQNQPYIPLPDHIIDNEPEQAKWFEELYNWGKELCENPEIPIPMPKVLEGRKFMFAEEDKERIRNKK